MKHQEGEFQASDGVHLAWQTWEPDAAPRAALYLLHGLGEHSGRYRHVGEALAATGLSLLAIDLRGHGRSGGPRGHTPGLEQYLDDTRTLLGLGDPSLPAFLYGHSLGGMLALLYGLQATGELKGIIASGPGIRRAFEVPAWKTTLAGALSKVWPTFAQHSGLDPQDISRVPEVVQAYRDDPLVHDWATARLYMAATEGGDQVLARAGEFHLPLLLLQGEEDRLISVEATRAFFEAAASPDKTLKLYPGLFHEVHNEPERETVLQAIIEWVAARC